MPKPGSSRRGIPEYRWNEGARRYVDQRGRFVKQEAVRGALEDVIDQSRQAMDSFSQQLIAEEISTAEWQAQMAGQMQVIHSASAAAARGGWAQMSQADWGFVGSLTKKQYGFLQDFANDVASGKQPLNGNLIRRARMYGDAARNTSESMRRRMHRDQGFTEERRVLGVADHCHTQGGLLGCKELAAKDWQPLGTLPPIGGAPCRTNCKCHFEYRNEKGEVSE